MAPPIKKVNEKLIEDLASMNCSIAEIAAVVGVDRSTLHRRYATLIEKGRECGKSSLKKKMFDVAIKGNVTMLIWMSKQMLGYKEPERDRSKDEEELSDLRKKLQAIHSIPELIRFVQSYKPALLEEPK